MKKTAAWGRTASAVDEGKKEELFTKRKLIGEIFSLTIRFRVKGGRS